MDFKERIPLPACCQECEERIKCLARGEGEWCCDECEYLAERFIPSDQAEITASE